MKCSPLRVGGLSVIVCGGKRIQACCKCREVAGLLCDWKIGNGRTCDSPICSNCSTKPAPDKDLCPQHAEMWKVHPRNANQVPQ